MPKGNSSSEKYKVRNKSVKSHLDISEDRGYVDPEELAVKVKRIRWPGKLFWVWAGKSVFRSFLISLLLGLAWFLLTWKFLDADRKTVAGQFTYMISMILDTAFIFAATTVSTLSGLSLHTADVIGYMLKKGYKTLVNRYMVVLIICLFTAIVTRKLFLESGITENKQGITMLVFLVTILGAFSASYNVYMTWAVLTPEERNEEKRRKLRKTRVAMRWVLPLRDRTRMTLPIIPSVIFLFASFPLVGWIADRNGTIPVNILYLTILSVMISIWCVTRRVIDVIKPWGENEKMYPYFEDYR